MMKAYRIEPGVKVKLDKIDSDDTGDYDAGDGGKIKAKARTAELLKLLARLQEKLYANASQALLIVLQGMDTSGKDGTIKHVMSGVNPLGCRVSSFKVPSSRERSYDFLWRVHKEVPPKGYIGLFNRSHYEDVVITRVHGIVSEKVVEQRVRHIRRFEELLHDTGTTILKFFLHISKDEQRKRLEERVRNPKKRWKFDPADLSERKLWNKYMKAYEDAISATSTEYAPWHVVPANQKWYRNLAVAETVVTALESLKLRYPPGPAGVDFDKLKVE
jgi:PPK2 family polyphosphate:nucleotide phosphotransferase